MLTPHSIIETFQLKFKTSATPYLFQAPGRVNLIGEPTDYNDGFVLPTAIDRHVLVAALPRPDNSVNIYASNFDRWDRFEISPAVDHLLENTWANYIRGMSWSLLGNGHRLRGMDMTVTGNIPIGAGLSSSAAIEIAVGFAFLQVSGVEIDRRLLALAAQKAENEFVGMRCGIMDQFISCLGQKDHALLIDCRELSYQRLPLPAHAAVIIVDSGVYRGLTDMAYNTRRNECETAAAHFGVKALRDVTVEQFQAQHHALLPVVARRARHVITENHRTLAAAAALKKSDVSTFGQLMTDSHRSLKEDFEVSCPELDLLVDIALNIDGVYGARLTGAGFGGCIVALADHNASQPFIRAINKHYPHKSGKTATIYICKASQGVSPVEVLDP